MTTENAVRVQFGFGEKYDLPSRFWEPEPDKEYLERMEREYKDNGDEPLPFK